MTSERKWQLHIPLKGHAQTQVPTQITTLEDYPYKSVSLASTRANLTGLWRYWRPVYQTKRAPCDANCPVGNQVVEYIQALLAGQWHIAASILRAENPLPAITGRICHRPCEMNCNRRQYDTRIAIHDIEAALAEVPIETLSFPEPERTRTVAVVGSGPAQLTFAHFLAQLHHQVTLFDATEALGGRLRFGPQARHLSSAVLDAEIERIVSGRVKVRRHGEGLAQLGNDFDVVFGILDHPERLSLHISDREQAEASQQTEPEELMLGSQVDQSPEIKTPLRVSDAIGYGKWAALLLDAYWRRLNTQATLADIQIAGNRQIVSATKYLALLTGHELQRSEEVVTYEKLHLDMLEPQPAMDPGHMVQAQAAMATDLFSDQDLKHVIREAGRCFSCGRCNDCDNCWIFCPDAVISHEKGRYTIDYDYCKGCMLCAAVCPRAVVSTTTEEA
jgi:Pyruvate/2-oxoacid:ferredoxin oxidoreductase delta subunit